MKKIIGFILATIYNPLCIYGLVVCCMYCSWLVYIPVLIIGITSIVIDLGIIVGLATIMDEDEGMSLKQMDEFLSTGGGF